jgi:hypothetical protein
VLALAAAAVVTLALAFAVRAAAAVPVALVGLGAAWTLAAWSRGGKVPDGTIVVAAGIFAVAELAYWSLEQVPASDEPELAARRLGGLAVRVAAAFVLAAILVAALGLHAGGGLALETVGVAAAVGVVALTFALARAESSER